MLRCEYCRKCCWISARTKPAISIGGVKILGQIQDSYIIACDSQGLLIIDQHVAHERIIYERLAAAAQKDGVEMQGLLVPLSVELPPHQVALLERMIPELNRNVLWWNVSVEIRCLSGRCRHWLESPIAAIYFLRFSRDWSQRKEAWMWNGFGTRFA